MTCHAFRLPDGTSGFVCTRGKRVAKCFYCNAAHTRLYDFVIVPETTYSRKLCANHAYGPPGGDDFCPDHATAKPAPAVVTTLHVWTGTTYWHRSDPDALDVTIMTGGANGRPFAPSMAIFKPAMKARDDAERIEAVAALHEQTDPPKARELREEAARLELQTWAVYKRQYLAEMLVSSGRDVPEGWARDVALAKARGVVKHVEAWQAELARSRRIYLCYCPPSTRTETVVRCHAGLLATVFARLGATYMGELEKSPQPQTQLPLAK